MLLNILYRVITEFLRANIFNNMLNLIDELVYFIEHLSENHLHTFSHYMSAWQCMDITRRSYKLITSRYRPTFLGHDG